MPKTPFRDAPTTAGGGIDPVGSRVPATDAARALLDSMNSTPAGVVVANREGRVVYANPAFLRLFEYDSLDVVVGCPAADLFSIQEAGEVARGRSPERTGGQLAPEFQVYTRTGHKRALQVTSSMVLDATGAHMGVVVSFIDNPLPKLADRQHGRLIQELQKALSRAGTLRELLSG